MKTNIRYAIVYFLFCLVVFSGCEEKQQDEEFSEEITFANNSNEQYETRFPQYDLTPKGTILETFQVKARFVDKKILYESDYKKQMLEHFSTKDKQETYTQLKKEFDGWEDFDDLIYEFEFLTTDSEGKYPKGRLYNILITSQNIDRAGFTKTIIEVPDFENEEVVLLTLTHELPFGWEAIRDAYETGITGFIGCLRIAQSHSVEK